MQRMEQGMVQRQREADARQQLAAEEGRIKEDSASAEAAGRRLERAADIERWPSCLCANAQLWDLRQIMATVAWCYLSHSLPVKRLARALSSSKLANLANHQS